MSQEIDKRVVQMQFDNKQFERGAKETLSTLDKLKQALNMQGSSKGLEELDKAAKNVSLDNIAKSVEFLEKRFSALGIVGMRVLQNITDGAMNVVNKGLAYVNDAIISGGIRRAQNLENAHFMLQALLKDEEKVQAVMDDANKSVDGTRYSLDEAAKTAAQFSASGIQAGDDMLNALRGVVGVASMTNSEFEGISQIFTAVSGQGRLMGDQLLQLAGRGLNAAAVITDFVNGVNDGSKEASDGVKTLVKEITEGTKVTEADIRELTSKGKISFRLFSEAMTEAFADSAERANETFSGALANVRAAMARIGAGFVSPLIAQNNEVIKMFNAIRVKVNEVKKVLVFDESIKNVDALSKRFTDSVLAMAGSAAKFIENLDVTKPTQVAVHGINSIINIFKGLGSVLKPIGKAFSEVFLDFGIDDVLDLASAIEDFTSKLKLSESASKNLHDTFKGLFSISKLVVDVFFSLVKAIFPVTKPVTSLSELILSLTGAIGRSITGFTEWIRQSTFVSKAYDVVASAIQNTMGFIAKMIISIGKLVKIAIELPQLQFIIEKIVDGFRLLNDIAGTAINYVVDSLVEFSSKMAEVIPDKMAEIINSVAEAFSNLDLNLNGIDFSRPSEMFGLLAQKINELFSAISKKEGVDSFITNLKEYLGELKEAFTFDRVVENVELLKKTVGGFGDWVKSTLGPLFSDMSFGGILATGAGVGMGYGILNIVKSLNNLSSSIKSIPSLLGGVRDVLVAYQNDLKADTLKKIAAAVLLFCGALTVLSFVDTERLSTAAVALSGVAAIIGGVIIKLKSLEKAVPASGGLAGALTVFSKTLGLALDNLVKAVKKALTIKFLGSMVKDFAVGIGVITASIVAIAVMYKKDSESLMYAVEVIKEIGTCLALLMGGVALITDIAGDKAMKAFKDAGKGLTGLAASVLIIVVALEKLFKIEFPEDYKLKLGILAGIIVGLGVLATAMDVVSKKWGGGKVSTETLLPIALGVFAVVKALKQLFEIELPYDYDTKLTILGGIFVGLGALILALGKAGQMAGGALKATGPILAMCLFIPVVVGALAVLTLFPGDELLKAAVALGAVLLALGGALYGAGKVSSPESYKSVLAMATITATIAGALGVLSLIPMEMLAKAAVALGAMLIVLAGDLLAASKIQNEGTFKTVLAMVAVVVSIAASLAVLANYSWEQLLGAATAIGEVLLAVSVAFGVIGLAKPNESAALMFLAGIAAIAAIAYAIYELSKQPAEQLLAAATAISEVLVAMSLAFGVATLAGAAAPAAIAGIALLDLFIANFALVLVALGAIFKSEAAKNLLGGGASVLAQIGEAIGAFAGNIVGGFLGGVSDAFPKIGENLAAFMENAKPFIEGAKTIDDKVINGVVKLAEAFAILTAAELVSGIMSFVNGGNTWVRFGEQLVQFGPYLKQFADSIKGVSGSDIESAANAALMMSEVAAKLPHDNPEWLTKWIGNKKTLSEFAAELVPFGVGMKAYSETIKGIDPDIVVASANAASALVELAKDIPNSGGVVGWIMGENDIDDFGKKLVVFGECISDYADEVKDLNPEVVTASVNASTALVELAKEIPNTGGALGWIMGNNDIDNFGKQLVVFGDAMSDYADSVKGLDPGVVKSSANAAEALVKLAKNLPNDGGIVSWFTGNNNIGIFGDNIRTFGEGLNNYFESIRDIDTGKMSEVTDEVKELIAMAKQIDYFDPSGLYSFSSGLQTMAQQGVKLFIDAFKDSKKFVKDAVEEFLEAAKSALDAGTNPNDYHKIGAKLMEEFLKGITDASDDIYKEVKEIVSKIPKEMSAGLSTDSMFSYGQSLMLNFINGMKSRKSEAVTQMRFICEAVSKTLSTSLDAKMANQKGVAFIDNLVNGMNSGKRKASDNIKMICSEVIKVINSDLGEKKGKTLGNNFVIALRDGIQQKRSLPSDEIEKVAKEVLKTINNKLSEKEFTKVGEGISNGMASGIGKNERSVTNAVKALAKVIIDTFKSEMSKDKFEDIGENAATGMAKGIENKMPEVKQKATEMAKASSDAAKNTLDEHSPSKVFEEIGENASAGMAIGIENTTNQVAKAGENLAENAIDPVIETIDPLKDAMKTITDVASSGTETDFKIVPDVQLQNTDAASSINNADFMNAFNNTASKLGVTLTDFASDVMTLLGINMPREAFLEAGKDLSMAFISGINSRREYVLGTMRDFSNAIIKEMRDTIKAESFKEIGMEIIQAFVTGINANNVNTIPNIKKFYAYLNTVMKSNLKEYKFEELGTYILEQFVEGMEDRSSKITNPIKDLCKSIVKSMEDNLSKDSLAEVIEEAMDALSKSVTDNRDIVLSEIIEFGTEMATAFKEGLPKDEVTEIATELMTTIAEVVDSKKSDVIKNIEDVGKEIIETLKKELDKTTAKEMAEEFMDAFIDGYINKKGEAVERANEVARAVVKALNAGLQSANYAVKEAGDNLDTSGYKKNIENITAYFDIMMKSFVNNSDKMNHAIHTGISNNVAMIGDTLTDSFNIITKRSDEMLAQFGNVIIKGLANTSKKIGKDSKKVGNNLAEGFIRGIKDKMKEVKDTVTDMAEEAIKAAMKAFDEHSPSRVFFEIGQYASIGLANGLMAALSMVTGASDAVSNASIGVLDKATDPLESKVSDISKIASNPISTNISLGTDVTGSDEASAFIGTLNGSMSKVNNALNGLIGDIVSGMETEMPDEALKLMGKDIVQKLMDGFNSRRLWALQTSETFGNDVLKRFEDTFTEKKFSKIGDTAITALLKGMTDLNSTIKKTINDICDVILKEFDDRIQEKVLIVYGNNIIQWIIKGIDNNKPNLISTIKTSAEAIIDQLEKTLSVDKLYSIGAIIPAAIIASMEDAYEDISNAVSDICTIIIGGFTETINENLPSIEEATNSITDIIIENLEKIAEIDMTSYYNLGENIITSINDGFYNKQDELVDTIDDLCETLMNRFNELLGTEGMEKLGDDASSGFAKIIDKLIEITKEHGKELKDALSDMLDIGDISTMFDAIMKEITEKAKEFGEERDEMMERIKNGQMTQEDVENLIGEGSYYTKEGITEIIRRIFGKDHDDTDKRKTPAEQATENQRKKEKDDAEKRGEDIGKGMVDGIRTIIDKISGNSNANPGTSLGNAVSEGAKEALGIHSPSTVFQAIGENVTKGFIKGIVDPINDVRDSANRIANETINPFKSAVDEMTDVIAEEIQNQPIITPILDLSDIQSNMDEITKMFNQSFAVPLTYDKAVTASAKFGKVEVKEIDNENKPTDSGVKSIVFEQNNYSPKALSNTEIYRQTKNQFSAFAKVVDAI